MPRIELPIIWIWVAAGLTHGLLCELSEEVSRRYYTPYSEVAAIPGANASDWCYNLVMQRPDIQGATVI